ncbi:flagellar M-ring protein FliF [Ideonella azotifigens]|uniref:Flagellar M-ring protein n=1 Tax=Ideonella azotifigens TaxID=513160 RepID=A0ABP3VLF6_9BURK|nr:flagellar basal-body MS-ring/collar protein FliF [Ideonella azotifigens]MCD2339116.1 flagellar M-ring protein FliF [Ideonella azotifigens]
MSALTGFPPLFARLRSRLGGGLPLAALTRGLLPLVLLTAGVTALVLMLLWRDQAGYKPVFGQREKVSAGDMVAVLDAEHIPYRLHPDSGQVLVPEDKLGQVRMLLAAKGVTARLPAGLELMDRNDPLGVSQFVQDMRFRRGLEGELAQSIMTLDPVESARVHLSVAKSTSFVMNDGEKSSASVVLQLKPGRHMAREQIAATISLVAGSLASLDPQRVSVVDQAGNLLSAHVDLSEGFDAGQGGEAANRFQDDVRRNVNDLLAPVLGSDNYKLSVTAEVDNDKISETREQYGAAPKVTSEAMREEKDRDAMALGVPGSLSNRPVALPSAASAPAGGEASTATKNATSRQFAYDRSITQIQRSRGRLSRMNVAVVLNSAAAPGGAKAGWSKEELANVERILRSGLGINAERGDTLTVSALAFPALPAAQPWWQERDTVLDATHWASWAVGGLLLLFLVLRPLTRAAQQRLAPQPELTPLTPLPANAPVQQGATVIAGALPAPDAMAAGPTLASPAEAAQRANPVVPLLENYDLPPPGSPVDVLVDHLKSLAGKEPERVAEVVKQWMQKHAQPQ